MLTPRLPSSLRAAVLVFAGAVLLWPASARARTFKDSHAPVRDDPSLPAHGADGLWPHVDLKEARRLWGRKGVVFLDGRDHYEWQVAHIPGAVSTSPGDFDNVFPTIEHRLIRAKVVVCYCHGLDCGVGDFIANRLAALGLRNMCVFSGGYPQWLGAGYPLAGEQVPAKNRSPAPRGP